METKILKPVFDLVDPIELGFARKCYEAGSTRHYHTFEHAQNVMRSALEHPSYFEHDKLLVQKAVLWHDAYYVAGDDQNEEKSCELSYAFTETNDDMLAITKAIMATKHKYEPWTVVAEAIMLSDMARMVADADMVQCACSIEQFRENSHKIKLEFTDKFSTVGSSITPEEYDRGRKQWAQGMLNRSRLFWDDEWETCFSDQIQRNLLTLV